MIVINNHQFFNPVGMKQFAGIIMADMFIRCHHIAGHQSADAFQRVFSKPHITVGQDTDQFRAVGFSHRNTTDAMLLHQSQRITQGFIGGNRQGIHYHPCFKSFDRRDLFGVVIDAHVFVDNPKPAQLRHGDGQGAFGNGIHRR